jgi:UDP-N-acetyl-D-galactosamine dehydrogenase
VILAGRRVNDQMGAWIAQQCLKYLYRSGNGKTVVILGITFKENVPDIRNSKVIDIVTELRSFGADVHIADPLANPAECQHEYGITPVPLADLPPADAVILAVSHDEYKQRGWPLAIERLKPGGGLVVDVKAVLDRAGTPPNVRLWRM